MKLLIVGSLALDSIETVHEKTHDVLGGSAVYAAGTASLFTESAIVGVVGEDFPMAEMSFLRDRKVDLSGVSQTGASFRWGGRYSPDFNHRDTLFTELGSFATFDPKIPEKFQDAEFVFLGNIDPKIQLRVVEQIKAPKLVAADSMNFWIHGHREALLETIRKVDVLLINEEEARDLAEEKNLIRAAKIIRRMGPHSLVIKRGENGAMLFYEQNGEQKVFYAPAFPLEDVRDPTGAGDSFAGGFMGSICQSGQVTPESLKRAMAAGSAVASFTVEAIGTRNLRALTINDVQQRLAHYRALTAFE
jgi:sugar/nucleoside kinase (ribokinase family)